jgi:hypothetical protein
VLDRLTSSTGSNVNRNRLLVMPWAYGANAEWIDGATRSDFPEIGPNSRTNQVRYLTNVGIPFAPAFGEHGDPDCDARNSVADAATVEFHKRVIFEWGRAVNSVGGIWFKGWANHVFSEFHQTGAGTQVGYSMPFLRHLEAFLPLYRGDYWPGFYFAFPYVQSRQTTSFNTFMLVNPWPKGTFLTTLANGL